MKTENIGFGRVDTSWSAWTGALSVHTIEDEPVRHRVQPDVPSRFGPPYPHALTPYMYAWLHHLGSRELLDLWSSYLETVLGSERAMRWTRWLRNNMRSFRRRKTDKGYRVSRSVRQLSALIWSFFRLTPDDLLSPIQAIYVGHRGEWWLFEHGDWFLCQSSPLELPSFLVDAPLLYRWATVYWWLLYMGLGAEWFEVPHCGFPSYMIYDSACISWCAGDVAFTEGGWRRFAHWLKVPEALAYSVPAVVLGTGRVLSIPPSLITLSPSTWVHSRPEWRKWIDISR